MYLGVGGGALGGGVVVRVGNCDWARDLLEPRLYFGLRLDYPRKGLDRADMSEVALRPIPSVRYCSRRRIDFKDTPSPHARVI